MNMQNKKQGFIQIIIIVVLLVIILSLLGVSLSSLFSNPLLKDNLGFVWNGVANVWNNYLSVPFYTIWHVFQVLIWQPLMSVIQKKP
ncbi:MAG: hypothetical protein Q7S12_04940 [bacterium]|nr:hypothetical protein [bacterium]